MTADQPSPADGATPTSGATCCAPRSLDEEGLDSDLETLAAVASETRYRALRLLADADGEVCVCELEPALGVSQGAVSQGLSRLAGAGLVTRRKEGRWRYYDTTDRAERLLTVLDETRGAADA